MWGGRRAISQAAAGLSKALGACHGAAPLACGASGREALGSLAAQEPAPWGAARGTAGGTPPRLSLGQLRGYSQPALRDAAGGSDDDSPAAAAEPAAASSSSPGPPPASAGAAAAGQRGAAAPRPKPRFITERLQRRAGEQEQPAGGGATAASVPGPSNPMTTLVQQHNQWQQYWQHQVERDKQERAARTQHMRTGLPPPQQQQQQERGPPNGRPNGANGWQRDGHGAPNGARAWQQGGHQRPWGQQQGHGQRWPSQQQQQQARQPPPPPKPEQQEVFIPQDVTVTKLAALLGAHPAAWARLRRAPG